MAKIDRRHFEGCSGEGCSCPSRLDYWPLGLAPPRKRSNFQQRKRRRSIRVRHSYASRLIAAGGPITEVQHRLGHSNPSVTLKFYSHWFKDADTGAGERFAAGFLRGSSAHLVPTLGNTGVISANMEPAKLLRK